MNIKTLIPILKSWETGYIAPSAQIAIRDAIEALLAQDEEISELKVRIEELEENLLKAQSPKTSKSKSTVKTNE